MTIKFGYQLHEDYRRNFTGDDYHFLSMTIFANGGSFGWKTLLSVEWQNTPGVNEWYGMRVQLYSVSGSSEFSMAVKILNKMEKADVFGYRPAAFVEWLSTKVRASRVVYDYRMSELRTLSEYLADYDKTVYRFYSVGSFIDRIAAYNEQEARDFVSAACYAGKFYNNKSLLENEVSWHFSVEEETRRDPVIELQDWLKLPQY